MFTILLALLLLNVIDIISVIHLLLLLLFLLLLLYIIYIIHILYVYTLLKLIFYKQKIESKIGFHVSLPMLNFMRLLIWTCFFTLGYMLYSPRPPKQPFKAQPETSMLAMPAVTTTENQNGKMNNDNNMLVYV